MSDSELWRPCLIDSRWEISNHGRVRGGSKFTIINYGLIRKLRKATNRYISAWVDKELYSVHRLVGQHFVQNPRPDVLKHIDHIDGDRSNNHWLNLRWVNRKLNMRNCQARGWNKTGQKFCVSTRYNNKHKYHGVFETEHEAHSVYKKVQAEAFRCLYVELTGDPGLGLGPEKFLTEKDFQILAESNMSKSMI